MPGDHFNPPADAGGTDLIAALPQHMSESLRLSGARPFSSEASPRVEAEPPEYFKSRDGKPKAYRHVRRQSHS